MEAENNYRIPIAEEEHRSVGERVDVAASVRELLPIRWIFVFSAVLPL